MTQKEYNEKIMQYEDEIKKLKQELDFEQNKSYNYERVLEDYYRTSEDLRKEKEWNKQNVCTIERLQNTIDRYEKILDKFTINF